MYCEYNNRHRQLAVAAVRWLADKPSHNAILVSHRSESCTHKYKRRKFKVKNAYSTALT